MYRRIEVYRGQPSTFPPHNQGWVGVFHAPHVPMGIGSMPAPSWTDGQRLEACTGVHFFWFTEKGWDTWVKPDWGELSKLYAPDLRVLECEMFSGKHEAYRDEHQIAVAHAREERFDVRIAKELP